MKSEMNYGLTENGAIKHTTTGNDLLDMFAQGGAYRSRSDEDCIVLFKKAFAENPAYALKCLFYLYDVRGGQGERRFFKVCFNWLIQNHLNAAKRNLKYIPEYGRWDMLYKVTWQTSLWNDAINLIKEQLALDMTSFSAGDKTGISLLAKWMPSENTSSKETQRYAKTIREVLGMTSRQYRKTLSVLRERIKVLERLMSANRWNEIEFDQIPSKAGLKYRNAFARRDMIAKKYEEFAKSKDTKVNAKTLYPYEVVHQARYCNAKMDDPDRLMINKYWDNLTDYFKDATLDAMCVCDTSGSMTWSGNNNIQPLDIAISLSLYCADKARGLFHGHYISFASRPQLIRTEGADFVDKVYRIYRTNLCDNTNIEATFDLILNMLTSGKCKYEDIPKTLLIISDMEFDQARGVSYYSRNSSSNVKTLMESIKAKWNRYGYKMPNLVFWNVAARNDNIPMSVQDGVMFVSGASPVILKQVLTNKSAYDLMYDVLDQKRYEPIH
jgi:hypothetical protein